MKDRNLVGAKIKAFGVHAVVTILVAVVGAHIVFNVWYPGELSEMLGGAELYKLVVAVELGLGPVMSLVIFNPSKPRSELIRDYILVGLVQFGALGYGLYVVAESRPAYMVFVKDRIEVVTPVQLSKQDMLESVEKEFRNLPWSGPQRICTESPSSVEEKNALLFSAAFGSKDIQLFPKYYRRCSEQSWLEKAYPADALQAILEAQGRVDDMPEGDFSWLPVTQRFGAWIEVYPSGDYAGSYFLPINPFVVAELEPPVAEG